MKESNIEIENKIIKEKIYIKLNKDFSEMITKKDLKKIKSIVLNKKDFNDKDITYNELDYKTLEYIEKITLNGFVVDDKMIKNLNYLKELKTIIFEFCVFKNNIVLSNKIEKVWITYSSLKDFNLFQNNENIKKITLIEVEEVDIKEIIKMKNIFELSIFNSKIKNLILINNFKNLKKLKLDGSSVDEKDFYKNLNKNVEFTYKDKYILGF